LADSRILVAIAGEDQAHRVLAMRLLDEVLLERAAGDWPEREQLDQARVWCGWLELPDAPESERYYQFKTLDEDLRRQMPRFFRVTRIDDQPAGEATWFISLYQLFALRQPRPDALIGMVDTDDPDLHQAADRAIHYVKERLGSPMVLAFGLPYRDAEAWFVAGLVDVPARLAEARRELHFDPQREPDRLTSQPNAALTDAKRVLRFLLGEGATLQEAPSVAAPDPEGLAVRTLRDLPLLERAEATGLARFVARLRSGLAPLILPGPPG
jgi:hypothetical protein